jgi:predicted NodU family carbamoyl transferase
LLVFKRDGTGYPEYVNGMTCHAWTLRWSVRASLCAVNHVDNTGRVQSVSQEQNPRYYALIEAFAR